MMMKKRVFPLNQLLVFYDGWCPFCQSAADHTNKLDWFKRVQFLSFREEGVVRLYQLNRDNCEQRICSQSDGVPAVYEGIFTVLQIAYRIPAYWIWVPLIWISIGFGFGQSLYDWIAQRRSIIPVGKCNSSVCQLPDNPQSKSDKLLKDPRNGTK